MQATIRRDIQEVTALLSSGVDPNVTDKSDTTALILSMRGYASEHSVAGAQDAIARLLLARGAPCECSRLTQFASQPELLAFLLEKGADVNARSKEGTSAVMLAARHGKDYALPLLLARRGLPRKLSPLRSAARSPNHQRY